MSGQQDIVVVEMTVEDALWASSACQLASQRLQKEFLPGLAGQLATISLNLLHAVNDRRKRQKQKELLGGPLIP